MTKRYTCPNCGNNNAADIRAAQRVWVSLAVGEYEDGTHMLEDAELTDDYFGRVELFCQKCDTAWEQDEIG